MTSTYKLTVIVDKRDVEHASTLIEELLDATAISLKEVHEGSENWTVEGYFLTEPPREIALNILDALQNSTRQNADSLVIEELPEEDWVSKVQSNLSPVSAGDIVIHGSHDTAKFVGKKLAIEVDAGQAFGTAHHGTTKGCLLALQRVMKRQQFHNILDLGTGSGVLAIAAAKLQKSAYITASDIDPISVRVARENCVNNNVGHLVETLCAPGLHHSALQSQMPYDLLVANILAGPLIKMAPDLSQAVISNGYLILSGLLRTQSRSVIATYRNNHFTLESRIPLDEWMTLILKRT